MKDYEINNLRTIIFWINILQSLYNENWKDKTLLLENIEEILTSSIIITNEYKKGGINPNEDIPVALFKKEYSNLEYLDKYLWLEGNNADEKTSNELTPKEIYNTYFNAFYLSKTKKYYFFKSIYQFITLGYLDINLLLEELQELQNTKNLLNKQEEEKIVIYRAILNYLYIDDEKYVEVCNKCKKLISDGEYQIHEVINLAYCFTLMFESDLKQFESIEELIDFFKNASNDAIPEKNRYIDNFPISFDLNSLIKRYPSWKVIYDKCLEKNEEFKIYYYAEQFSLVKSKFENDLSGIENNDLHNLISWAKVDILKELILPCLIDKNKREHLYSKFRRAYDSINSGEFYYHEKPKLELLIKKLNENLDAKQVGKVTRSFSKTFIKLLETISAHLEQTKK